MFRKVETGTIVITEVEDVADSGGIAAAPYSTAPTSNAMGGGEGEGGQGGEGESTDDKKPLVGKKRISWRELLIYNRWMHMVYLLLLCVMLGLIIPYLLASFAFPATINNARGSCALNISYRFDCMPAGRTVPEEAECHSLGCCFDHNSKDLYAPTCFHSIPSEYAYLAYNVNTTSGAFRTAAIPDGGPRGGVRRVYSLSEAGEITLELTPLREQTNLGTEAWSLRARVQLGGSDGDVVRVAIYSPEHDDFVDDFPAQSTTPHQLEVTVTQDPGGDFNVTVTRVATGEDILETVFGPMIYGKGYAELTTRIPTSHLYGLGLRRNFEFSPSFSERPRWPLFTKETFTMSGNVSVATGISGAHPFYMNFEKTPGYMYGLYLKTSAPVEVGVIPVPAVVFRGVGTLWDLRIMAGPTPRDVTRQYTGMVGRPAMPPYWALGYHLCRAASETDYSTYDKVVEGMIENQIPYESDCIDARLNYPGSFTPLPTEVQQRVAALRGEGRKFTLAQYPFVTYGSGAYNESSQFLLRHNDSTDYYGSIEGQAVGYPDYANENTLPLWLTASADVRSLYEAADGVFLLHNTPLNEATLNYTSWNGTGNCSPSTPQSCCPDLALPFLPQGVEDINNHSLCVALVHPSLRGATHLRLHNSYGYYHHRRIRSLMQEITPKSRPFVTSQSTHTGSGAEGAAFGESFGANFIEQKVALVQVLELGLYGMSLAGLPICGSRNDTSGSVRSEWCLRGHQMAAFWPLMVSHYEHGHQARNPTDFDKAFSHQLAVFIRMRYTLLPYFYTLMYEATQQGTPVVRPLFYEFPEDAGSRSVSSQFLVGSGLLVSPVLQSVGEQDSVDANLHFPPGRWYNFFSGATEADGVNSTDNVIPTLLADVNVHVRGGAVVPLQGNLHEWIKTTEDSRAYPFTLLVALCCNASSNTSSSSDIVDGQWAAGSLYLDDGVTPHDLTSGPTEERLQMNATDHQLTVTRAIPPGGAAGGLCSAATPTYSTVVNSVKVYGVDYVVGKVTAQGLTITNYTQDADTGALTIQGLAYDWCVASHLVVTWDREA